MSASVELAGSPEPRPAAWKVWLLATRPATLTASVAPVMAGSALAWARGALRLDVLATALFGAALIQIGTNLANDYFDFKKGADTAERLGPARVTQKGWVTPEAVFRGMVLAFVGATLAGVHLVWVGGWPIVVLGLASIAAGVGYTAGRYALAYLGLGELFVFLFFGLVAVVATYGLHGAPITDAAPWAAGVALGAMASAVLVVNNLRDRDTDVRAHKRTMAVRIGATWTRREYAALMAAPHAVAVAYAVTTGAYGWLATLVTAPLTVAAVRRVYAVDGRALNPMLGQTAKLVLLWAAALSAGVVLS